MHLQGKRCVLETNYYEPLILQSYEVETVVAFQRCLTTLDSYTTYSEASGAPPRLFDHCYICINIGWTFNIHHNIYNISINIIQWKELNYEYGRLQIAIKKQAWGDDTWYIYYSIIYRDTVEMLGDLRYVISLAWVWNGKLSKLSTPIPTHTRVRCHHTSMYRQGSIHNKQDTMFHAGVKWSHRLK